MAATLAHPELGTKPASVAASGLFPFQQRKEDMSEGTTTVLKIEDELVGTIKRYLEAAGELDRDSRSAVIQSFEDRMTREVPHAEFDFDPAWISEGNNLGKPQAV